MKSKLTLTLFIIGIYGITFFVIWWQFYSPTNLESPLISTFGPGRILEWEEVPHADYYRVYLNDDFIVETTENTHIFNPLEPYQIHEFKVEAYSNHERYRMSEDHLLFNMNNRTEFVNMNHGFNYDGMTAFGVGTASPLGYALFEFIVPFSSEYMIEIYVNDELYDKDQLLILVNSDIISIPYDSDKGGYIADLERDQYLDICLADLSFFDGVFLKIGFANIMDLGNTNTITVPPNTTEFIPITQNSSAELIQLIYDENVTVSVHDMWLDTLKSTPNYYYHNQIDPLGRYLKIDNTTDEVQTISFQKLAYTHIEPEVWIPVASQTGNKVFVFDEMDDSHETYAFTWNSFDGSQSVQLCILNRINERCQDIEMNQLDTELTLTITKELYDFAIVIMVDSDTISEGFAFKMNIS